MTNEELEFAAASKAFALWFTGFLDATLELNRAGTALPDRVSPDLQALRDRFIESIPKLSKAAEIMGEIMQTLKPAKWQRPN